MRVFINNLNRFVVEKKIYFGKIKNRILPEKPKNILFISIQNYL
jgi:hypothetical protein